jgi:holo-[acyl-carrier protein] synthase
MIKGIGIDIIAIERLAKGYEHYGESYVQRLLTPKENGYFQKTNYKAQFLARHFAAKEAFVKALGVGFRQGVTLKKIAIEYEKGGKPFITCFDTALSLLTRKGAQHIHLSITDESGHAVALVILED